MSQKLFTPAKIGPITLRNRSIRSAAFEGMCPQNRPSADLLNYHRSVAAGGIGMTTLAYAAVEPSGLSFDHQLLLNRDVIHALREITDAIHAEGAAASVQIGHCGLMAKKSLAGSAPLAPTGGINLYGPTFPKTMNEAEIHRVIRSFGQSVHIAMESGFDAVEVHAGHGYLISQFLSPFLNKRKDRWGGSFENRSRFMVEVMKEVIKAAQGKIAVIVKLNIRDGVQGGVELDEALEVARILETLGTDALIPSGGLVFRSPMYVMRGMIPVKIMGHFLPNPLLRFGVMNFGQLLIKAIPYESTYFLDDAQAFLKAVKIPIIYVGGVDSVHAIDRVLDHGFAFVSIARALVHDPAFINHIRSGEVTVSGCNHANYCIAKIYTGKMECHHNVTDLPAKWKKLLDG